MAEITDAMLIAEIGSLITRVTLIDEVEGDYRMIGHAETNTTAEPPFGNVFYGLLEATRQIGQMTGRQLVQDSQLLMPQTSTYDGVSHLLVVTSAAGAMRMVITAIASDVSAHHALHASHATYTNVLQILTLDASSGQAGLAPTQRSWIDDQIDQLLQIDPEVIVLAGGLEGGAVEAVTRLAHIVRLIAMKSGVDVNGQYQPKVTTRPVIYAGNSAARETVSAILHERAEVVHVANLCPTLDRADLAPTQQELARLYEDKILPSLAGLTSLQSLSAVPVRTVCAVQGVITRFLAERTGRSVLTLDTGAAATAAFYASPGRFIPTVLGTIGTVYGLPELMATQGVATLARWLPFAMATSDVSEQLLNRTLRPYILPASRDDVYLAHAVACEALRAALARLREQTSLDAVDWIIAGGGILAHTPQPGLALLTILDALEPMGTSDQPIIDVHLDTLGLLVTAGAIAELNPEAALTLVDHDLLSNVPLARVVTLLGEGPSDTVAAEVELKIVGGATERIEVKHGTLARLPLPQGRYGELTIRPAAGVRIGRLEPGETIASDGGEIAGSALGVVIDARGRPLRLAEDPVARREQISAWLIALNVEPGPPTATSGLPSKPEAITTAAETTTTIEAPPVSAEEA
ncbi:glutamate mutase L [Candidatus Chloroploca asiatica]|nr:glutamate mutase L [Candidatus Chloroploca asiatica]